MACDFGGLGYRFTVTRTCIGVPHGQKIRTVDEPVGRSGSASLPGGLGLRVAKVFRGFSIS
jgi:hypothetical protein